MRDYNLESKWVVPENSNEDPQASTEEKDISIDEPNIEMFSLPRRSARENWNDDMIRLHRDPKF